MIKPSALVPGAIQCERSTKSGRRESLGQLFIVEVPEWSAIGQLESKLAHSACAQCPCSPSLGRNRLMRASIHDLPPLQFVTIRKPNSCRGRMCSPQMNGDNLRTARCQTLRYAPPQSGCTGHSPSSGHDITCRCGATHGQRWAAAHRYILRWRTDALS